MDHLEELSARLVAADTVSRHGDLAVMELLGDRLAACGFEVRLQRYGAGAEAKANLVAWGGPPEPGGLALSGHVDVVPFADQPGWTRDPLLLAEEGGRLYGRGTSDMKIFLAQCVEAVRGLDLRSLRRPLVVLFTSDEEIGCRGAQRLVPELPRLLEGMPLPRLCWIGEPTSWQVFHAHKGIVELEVRVRGRGGHSGVPEAGVNAIAVAARAVAAIGAVQQELREERDPRWARVFPDAPYTALNFGTIQGGTASNVIAEVCRLQVSYRPLPGEDPLVPYARIRERLEALDARDWGSPELRAEVELQEPLVVPALESPRGTALERALRARLGTEEIAGAPYCTDGGHFAAAGVASLVCGPGDLNQAHQPDESVSREALSRGPDLIRRVVQDLCGPQAAG